MGGRLSRCRIARSLAVSAMLLFAVSPALAADGSGGGLPDSGRGWQVRITGNGASPSNLIAVDKKQQTLFLFERHSPLRLAGTYTCTTGQAEGDKFTEGDLKTPEGVYFVDRRIGSGLDFEKYGYEAYTLNYPNPVDKLRKKTGYGIWIHGRGSPITPNLTEGCVSLNNTDLAVLGKNLSPGTPVTLAAAVEFTPDPTPEDDAVISALYARTSDWAKAWSGRSKKFFDYYDKQAYSLAQGESFDAFRQQKERVFKTVSFIDTKVRNVQALQGPGYWVTWFQQEYRASNLSTKGVRRLYWQKDKKGEFRIVGMEWAPHLSGTLTAGLNGAPVSSGTASAARPEPAPEKRVAVAAAAVEPESAQPAPASLPEKTPEKPVTVAAVTAKPEASPVPPAMAEKPEPAAVSVPPATDGPIEVAIAAMADKRTAEGPPRGSKAAPEPGKPARIDVSAFIESWRNAWESADLNAYVACYDKAAVQGGRTGAKAIRAHKAVLWKRSGPRQVMLTNIRITT